MNRQGALRARGRREVQGRLSTAEAAREGDGLPRRKVPLGPPCAPRVRITVRRGVRTGRAPCAYEGDGKTQMSTAAMRVAPRARKDSGESAGMARVEKPPRGLRAASGESSLPQEALPDAGGRPPRPRGKPLGRNRRSGKPQPRWAFDTDAWPVARYYPCAPRTHPLTERVEEALEIKRGHMDTLEWLNARSDAHMSAPKH